MNKKTQSGFAHIVILTVILAVALVGTLGFVYWQNFMQPKDEVVKTDDTKDKVVAEKPATNDDAVSTEGYLVLEDWGVKFKLPTNLGDNQIKYYLTTNSYSGDKYYEFSTSRVEALGGACLNTNQFYVSLGALSRMTTPSTAVASAPALASKIGDYYYYYSHPQATCSDYSTDIQQQDMNMIQTFLMSVEKK